MKLAKSPEGATENSPALQRRGSATTIESPGGTAERTGGMTFEEVEDLLPNGTHDASLFGLSLDLAKNQLTLDLQADMTSPVRELGPDEADSRPVRISIEGLCYFSVEPPDLANKYSLDGPCDMTSSENLREKPFVLPEISASFREHAFCQRLYLLDWNAFLIFAGTNARLEWLDNAQLTTGN